MTLRHQSQTGAAAYLDLLRSLQDETVTEVRGKPIRKDVNGRSYWYDNFRSGTEVVWRYIGEETQDLHERRTGRLPSRNDRRSVRKCARA